MNRRAALRSLLGLIGLFFVRLPAEAKAKPAPADISGLYSGRFGATSLMVRIKHTGETVRYAYRFRGRKRNFQGSGSAVLKGAVLSSKGVSVMVSEKNIRLYLPGGRSAVLKKA